MTVLSWEQMKLALITEATDDRKGYSKFDYLSPVECMLIVERISKEYSCEGFDEGELLEWLAFRVLNPE